MNLGKSKVAKPVFNTGDLQRRDTNVAPALDENKDENAGSVLELHHIETKQDEQQKATHNSSMSEKPQLVANESHAAKLKFDAVSVKSDEKSRQNACVGPASSNNDKSARLVLEIASIVTEKVEQVEVTNNNNSTTCDELEYVDKELHQLLSDVIAKNTTGW